MSTGALHAMTAWQPNFDWITTHLAVGGSVPPDRVASLARDHGVQAVVDLRNEGVDDERLVHCTHGIGRSAVLALCIMVARGAAPLAALRQMKDRRALVSPSPDQFTCWSGWLERWRRAHDVPWTVPTFDAFEVIAYRRLTGAS